MYILIFIGAGYLIKECLLEDNACVGKKWDWILGFILSASTVTGIYFDNGLPYEDMGDDFVGYFACIIGITPLLKCFFTKFYLSVSHMAKNQTKQEYSKPIEWWKNFVFSFALILGCWLFVWLAYYPGLWNYDPWQVYQFIDKQYTEFHPLVHTCLLGACYSIGLKMDNANYGVVIYDFFQMAIMAGIFAYTYCYICKHIRKKLFKGFLLLFYAVFPVNSILAISTTKDVIFSGLVLLCIVISLQIIESKTDYRRKGLFFLLVVICPIMMLFRNNAVYAFSLLGVCTFCWTIIHKGSWKICLFMGLCLLTFGLERSFLRNVLEADAGSRNELLSVPSQQFGRIYTEIDEEIDPEAVNIIKTYYDMDKLQYKPYIADYMKGGLKLGDKNSVFDYVKSSFLLFKKYPAISLDAFLYLTDGYWNINSVSFAELYDVEWDGSVEHRYGYLLTTIKPGFGIVSSSKLPWLETFMEKMISKNEYQKYPILSLLFAPALYIWILIICTVVFLKKRKKVYMLIVGFLWFLLATLLAGPCVLVRYIYPFIVCSPVLCCMLIKEIASM